MDNAPQHSPLPDAEPGRRRIVVLVVAIMLGIWAYSHWYGADVLALLQKPAATEPALRPLEPIPAPVTAAVAPPASAPVTALAPPPVLEQPSFDKVTVDAGGKLHLSGHAASGSVIIVTSHGVEIARAVADASGAFVLQTEHGLPEGAQDIAISGQSADGSQSFIATTMALTVPPAPVVTPVAPPAPPTPPKTAIAAPPPPLVAAPELALGAVTYDERGAMRFAGKAAPNTNVRLSVEGQQIGTVTADDAGRWTITPETSFAPGSHNLRLEQMSAAGIPSLPLDTPIVRAPPGAMAVPGSHIVVQPADELWALARTAYGHGEWYMQIYNANRNQIKDPRLIYPGQILAIPTPMPSPSSTSK